MPTNTKVRVSMPLGYDGGLQPWEAAHLLVEARTPFKHMGRTMQGVDCVGMLVWTALHLGLNPVDKKVYSREPFKDGLRTYLRENCGDPIPHTYSHTQNKVYAVNDIVLIQFPRHPEPSHVAIIAPHPYGYGMIHCYTNIGRVIYHRVDDKWERRFVEVYKWPAKH